MEFTGGPALSERAMQASRRALGFKRKNGPSGSAVFPPSAAEIPYRRAADVQSLGAEQGPLELQIAAEASKLAGRGDDAMAGDIAPAAVPHDVSDRARRPWPSRRRRDVAIGRDTPDGDAPDDGQNAVGEISQ